MNKVHKKTEETIKELKNRTNFLISENENSFISKLFNSFKESSFIDIIDSVKT